MPIAADFEAQRAELEALLASGLFARAPGLAQVLIYVCGKYFEGQSNAIKEYNIAIEALGRPASFDQKRDSIVRVEAHRLRKRLREFYEGQGAGHAIHIEIPSGQYSPRFVPNPALPAEHAQTALTTVEPATPPAAVGPQPVPTAPLEFELVRRGFRGMWLLTGAAVLVTAALGYAAWRHTPAPALVPLPSQGAPVAAENGAVRILAGVANTSYTDAFGHLWQGDRYFHGGTAGSSHDRRVAGTRDPRLFLSRREGAFGYDIPLRPGVYELRLYFAEMFYGDSNMVGGGETSRIFGVTANGRPLLESFDIIADAGSATADVKVFRDISPAPDGKLHLNFTPNIALPQVSGIEITPGAPGRMRPIRLVERDSSYIAHDGVFWEPDRFAKGGMLVTRPRTVAGGDDPELYAGERFGNVSYSIPVARGRYAVVLHTAESWFGPGQPGGGGAGSRLFDILCNGTTLTKNFDIFREAGGSNRPLVKVFHGIEPTAQGKLNISFIPVRNYACINALEVVDESR